MGAGLGGPGTSTRDAASPLPRGPLPRVSAVPERRVLGSIINSTWILCKLGAKEAKNTQCSPSSYCLGAALSAHRPPGAAVMGPEPVPKEWAGSHLPAHAAQRDAHAQLSRVSFPCLLSSETEMPPPRSSQGQGVLC